MTTPADYLTSHKRWRDAAACRDVPFFLDLACLDAVNLCETCPVRVACLAHAVDTEATEVVQAGISIGNTPIARRFWDRVILP